MKVCLRKEGHSLCEFKVGLVEGSYRARGIIARVTEAAIVGFSTATEALVLIPLASKQQVNKSAIRSHLFYLK